ncbi:polysaccharide deacetylase family protein [candidate division KSB1 bacterium]|nr:polysaccharide deacetylase family protein [candidate division KSB1 bacterium]
MFDEKSVVITFDDSYASVYEHALPVLRKYNYTATIFVITNYVNKWNDWDYPLPRNRNMHCSWEQLKELAAEGWEIGSHTASHRSLTQLSNSELRHELDESKCQLEKRIQNKVNVLSYPFGKFDDRVIHFAKMSGYQAACTLGHKVSKTKEKLHTLERRGVYFFEPFHLFKVKLQEGLWARCDDKKQRAITFCSHGSILLQTLRSYRNIT